MRTLTCCDKYDREVVIRRADMGHAARVAARRDHPRYVEAANQAKAAYLKARANQLEHAEVCKEPRP